MIELESVKRINDLKQGIEATTGETYTDLTEAVKGLKSGYGQGGEDNRFYELVSRTIIEVNDSKITTIGGSAFRSVKSLVELNLPNLEQVGMYAFENCTNLKTVNCPNLKTVGHGSFDSCSALEKIDFPYVTSISAYGFASCNNVETINLPSATYISNNNSLGGKVEHLVLPKVTSLNSYSIGRSYGFSLDLPVIKTIPSTAISAQGLKALILRNTETMVTVVSNGLQQPYHITGEVHKTYNPNGDKDGYIYVPRMFLSDEDETKDYRRATNWVAYGEDRFRAIEDWTVDGTVNGEMDWDRIKGEVA